MSLYESGHKLRWKNKSGSENQFYSLKITRKISFFHPDLYGVTRRVLVFNVFTSVKESVINFRAKNQTIFNQFWRKISSIL